MKNMTFEERLKALQSRFEQELRELQSQKQESIKENERKTLFLANLSHELRNPLNAIVGFSELLLSELKLNEEPYKNTEKYLANILEGARHLDSIVNRILDMAKIQSGTIVLREEETSILELYQKAINMISGVYNRDVQATSDGNVDKAKVYCDKNLTLEVFINLITNALKYSEPKTEVTVKFYLTQANDLIIEIIDKGFGMEPDEVKIALEPFGQNLRHFENRNSGLGLGLPFAKFIVEIHGGELKILSKKDHGTTIQILYPASRIRF